MNSEFLDYRTYMKTDYARYLMAFYCMPTLLKLKPSSLVSVDKNMMESEVLIKKVLMEVKQFNCQCAILYEDKDMLNLFIYQEEILGNLLKNQCTQRFLKIYGYDLKADMVNHMISTMGVKLQQYHAYSGQQNFPHEIGIALGYPLQDVEAFIRYQGIHYLVSGYWKVYHDVKGALRIFESYRETRQNALNLLVNGKDLKSAENIPKKIK